MGSFNNYLENAILNEVFGGVNFVPPAALYFGVSTTTINEDGTGITEPTDPSYARISVTNNLTNFPSTSNGTKKNGVAFNFAQATVNWGVVTYFFISDSLTGGNILSSGALTNSKTVETSDVLSIAVNSLTITLD